MIDDCGDIRAYEKVCIILCVEFISAIITYSTGESVGE